MKRTGPVLIAHYQTSGLRRMTESRAGFGLTLVEITRKLWQQHVPVQMRLPLTTEEKKCQMALTISGFR